MVGFPGEEESDFADTLSVVAQPALSRLHVFPFSPRPGTAAAELDGRVPAGVVRERSRRLCELGRRLAEGWAQSFVGRTVRVLFERRTRSGRLAAPSGLLRSEPAL